MQIYRTGGAVRDKFLNIKSQDNDYVVVGATIEEMEEKGFFRVGKSFPVFLHPLTKEEYALARKERKTGLKHQDFEFVFDKTITLEEDSLRRDFSCNAIYENIETGEIIDYHNGIDDIKNKILRHISPHFKEDPLRVLRACRFVATLDFNLAPETLSVCKQMVEEGAISHLSKTRIFQELEKSLQSPYFYRFIETARQIGLLKIIFPEVEALFLVPERLDFHPEKNTGLHTMLALKNAHSTDALVNFAILLHDIGKTKTNPSNWPSHHHHEELGIDVANLILKRINAPNCYKKFIPIAIKYHMVSHISGQNKELIMAELALILAKNSQCNYLERFTKVVYADLRGRKLDNFEETEKIFNNFKLELKSYYQIAMLPKKELISDLDEQIEKLKNNLLTKEDFYAQEITAIINRHKAN
ncbi:MAG: multifunctional CCA tRNA nucleotidyl transferase/2'3'-cyclic phosphodiesterase/2'nucleotidase/phosphatase [Alphaproteobacteria bacterium]|nr:multifunctional CCA tRNA nucleotidyl transferase/2'3'-cyclic phosphodiesterase/2'nucleotidase/phosphatase [Alphaproteobacteria bacterium]